MNNDKLGVVNWMSERKKRLVKYGFRKFLNKFYAHQEASRFCNSCPPSVELLFFLLHAFLVSISLYLKKKLLSQYKLCQFTTVWLLYSTNHGGLFISTGLPFGKHKITI